MNLLLEFLKKFSTEPTEETIKDFLKTTTIVKFKKKDFLLHHKNFISKLYFAKEGSIKTFKKDAKGKDYIRRISLPKAKSISFIAKKLSIVSYSCLTNETLYKLIYKEIEGLIKKILFLENIITQYQIASYLNLSLVQFSRTKKH